MYGVALEGGGAKGAYHIGAFKALKELKIDIGGITGASIGALNGAIITQGDIDLAYDLWVKDLRISKLFDLDENIISELKSGKFDKANIPYLFNVSKGIFINRGLDTTKIRELLNEVIDEDKIRNSKIDFGIVTISLSDLKPLELFKEDIPEGKLVEYLMASANFPAFKMDKMDGKKFIDGGMHDNLPINLLTKKGYTDIIAIRTYGIGIVKKVRDKDLNITYIQPNEDLGRTLDFDTERAKKNIELGYYDCLKVFQNLKGNKYYCEAYNGEFIEYLLRIFNEEKVTKIGELLGYTDIPKNRMLFEKILPKLESLLEMKGINDYQDIFIRVLEIVAEKYEDIEKFNIYKFDEFLDTIIHKYLKKPIKYSLKFTKLLKHSELLSWTKKNNIIIEIFKIVFIEDEKYHLNKKS